jgi:hypothetical protein
VNLPGSGNRNRHAVTGFFVFEIPDLQLEQVLDGNPQLDDQLK